MKRVVIESPYAGDVERNVAYARRAMRDSLEKGEAPLASHILYTQPGILDDNNKDERLFGIEAGLTWAVKAELAVFYVDYGYSPGMSHARNYYLANNIPYKERLIGKNNSDR